MTILNISIFTFLIGLGLFSYTIYERSLILSSEEQKPKTENLNYKNDKKALETLQNEKSFFLHSVRTFFSSQNCEEIFFFTIFLFYFFTKHFSLF